MNINLPNAISLGYSSYCNYTVLTLKNKNTSK